MPTIAKSHSSEPMTAAHSLRQCLGRFATGVTVVTCNDAHGRPCGITANSFSSVSLEPPLVLWNIAKVSNSLEAYLNAEHFAINVLADHQQDLASHFARSDHTLFDQVETTRSPDGVPLLPGALACFECRTHKVHDSGDHYIIVGRVDRFRTEPGSPLLFYAGQYATLPDHR
jgi:4-hydroxyphenylacetate 3-hydroxylase, reductase component